MKKIRMYLDYRCFPVWIYNDNGELIDNNLPKELKNDMQIYDAFIEIQNIYDNLFLDNSTEFKYIGFIGDTEREGYLKMIHDIVNLVKVKLDDSYIIEEKIEF